MGLGYDSYEEALEAQRKWERGSKPLSRNKGLSRSGKRINPRNDERREREFKRAYGGEERVDFVKDMACYVPGCGNPAENAHIETGGMGRKADADKVVNLCRAHHTDRDDSLHKLGSVERFDHVHGVKLRMRAAEVEKAWEEEAA